MSSPTGNNKRGLRFDASVSFGLHLILWLSLLAIFAFPTISRVEKFWSDHQKALVKDKTPASLPGGSQETMAPSKESAAANLAESQVSQAIKGELTEKDEKKVLEDTHENLLKAAEQLQQNPPADADMDKLTDTLKQQAYGDLSAQLKDLAAQALQDEINAQLNGGIYDQVKNKIEHDAATQMSPQIAEKLRELLAQERQKRIDQAVANLEQVKKDVAAARDAVDQGADNARNGRLDPAADSEKKSETAAADADKAAHDALAGVVKNFPQTAAQADQASNVFKGDTQQDLDAARNAIAGKNKDDTAAQFGKAHTSLDQRMNALSQMEDQVRQTGNAPNADPVSRQLLTQSTEEMQKAVGDELQKQSLDQMDGKITDRLTQALGQQAGNLQISPDQLHAMVEASVKARLAANLKDQPPQTDAALNHAKADNQLLTPDELEQARAAADAALKALTNARQTEANVAFTDAGKSADDLNKQQQQAVDQYDAAHQAMEKARDLARTASLADQDKVFFIGDADRRAEVAAKQKVIPDLVDANQRQPAERLKGEIVASLDERIGQMHDLEDSLARERDALAAGAKPFAGHVDVDPATAAALQKNMKEEVSKIAGQQLTGIVASAGDVEASDPNATDMRMEGIANLLGKVNQLESNLNDGRPDVGMDGSGLGIGMGVGAGGMPAAAGNLYGSRFGAINAEEIEKYGKDLRDRTNPDNFYNDTKETDDLATVAHAVDPRDLPAEVYFGPEDAAPAPDAAAPSGTPERKVPEPKFKTVAFGAAAMMDRPVTIDGDLSDWGELRHPIPTQFRSDGAPVTDPTQVYVRWTPEGLYIGYTTKKAGPIVPDAHQGDCMEVWIDGQNVRRKQMEESPTSQQLFLAPFGYKGDPTPAIVEVGRGSRGLKMYTSYVDRTGVLGKVAGKQIPGGYSVEAFISRKAIAYPNLVPGAYLAFNFSINRGPADTDWEQWSAPKSLVTWDKPDTWGDLLLLGSDAKARFISVDDPTQPAKPLIPGQVLAFEIQDKDMDLNPHKKDRVPAVLRIKGETDGLFVILEETAVDSGVFRASVNTQPYGAPPKENTLNIRGGESVELVYNDLRAEYGEANRVVTAVLPVGTPVLRLTAVHP